MKPWLVCHPHHNQDAKNWYIDRTFKLCKRPFEQLLSINRFVKSGDCTKQVPLAFVLMSRRTKKYYAEVLRSIIEILPENPAVNRASSKWPSTLRKHYGQLFEMCFPMCVLLDELFTGLKHCGGRSVSFSEQKCIIFWKELKFWIWVKYVKECHFQ